MAQNIRLDALFPLYPKDAPLAGALVLHADVYPAQRKVTVQLRQDSYCPQKELEAAIERICALYPITSLQLLPVHPLEALPEMDFSDLNRIFIAHNALAAGCLSGAQWCADGRVLTLRLPANGAEHLRVGTDAVREFLRERFGEPIELNIESMHVLNQQELFEATQQLRQDAIANTPPPTAKPAEKKNEGTLIYGRPFRGKATPISDLSLDMAKVIVEGQVTATDHRELKQRKTWVVNFDLTDYKSTVRIHKFFDSGEEAKPILERVKGPNPKKKTPGMWLRVRGQVTARTDGELMLKPISIMTLEKEPRTDKAPEKRVELHLHTNMSSMDALTDTTLAVHQAAKWGMPAIGITDHGVAQAYPEAMQALKSAPKVAGTDQAIKILYGCEGYYINDVDDRVAVHGTKQAGLHDEFVAFDLETTGLSARTEVITEIGAVIFRDGKPCEKFQTFVNPNRPLSKKISDLTGITDAMLADAPQIEQAMPAFLEFCGDRPLCAHNADFDIGFLTAAAARLGLPFQPTSIDTLILSQNLLPKLGKYKLDIVANALSLPDFQHHRASDDARTCGELLVRFIPMLEERGISELQQINPEMEKIRAGSQLSSRHARHIILYAKNQNGLRNLYHLISLSNLSYFRRVPRIPKSELIRYREGLLIGSACEAGELFQAVVQHKSEAELERITSFYDFLEIQPLCNNRFMLSKGIAEDEEELREFNRTVVRIGKKLGKLVVATGDVHFLNPEDEIFRHILLTAKGYEDADRSLPLYFRTTDEMLEEFSYLGEQTAYEIVVTNTNLIADMCDLIRPVPHNLFPPAIENSVEDLKRLVYGRCEELYGKNPPELITTRVQTELNDIISCHYDVIYMSAQKLVQNSLEHGYLVGSRGSVGSSIVAYLSGITEVNAFPPHYRCPNPACKYTVFDTDAVTALDESSPDEEIRQRAIRAKQTAACGADLPDAVCPKCGARFAKEGFQIPFETFLGFGGDKVPDIDLNFSGEYQANAHAYCVQMFGAEHVFRAGTIGGVAEKTAFGYAKKYLEAHDMQVSKAEELRLASGCVGVKRTTGQHPGGLVVIPQENEIWDFCPVQHPADAADSEIITTHFEYHCMEENLLKLDMLGHDDPTMIRMLEDMTGVDAKKIPLDDPDTMAIFTSSKILGYENDELLGPVGSCGIPEFGTGFTRGMLQETQPTEFDTLIRLSGFSHGTDVWLGNARDLILSNTATVSQAIGCRDDIMIYLIKCGLPEKRAFSIMEAVRKGRGLPAGAEGEMQAAGVPDWYIESCKKIQYLFPKAHAVAYVMMAFRIAWFKVHRPLAFYAAYFYRRSQKGSFNAEMMINGKELVVRHIKQIRANPDATAKEDGLLTTLEVCYEFYLRGFRFTPMRLMQSDATKFLIEDGALVPPFVAIAGLGETAAWDIAQARKEREFLSVEEFALACPKVSQTHIETLRQMGVFGDLPDTSQVSFF